MGSKYFPVCEYVFQVPMLTRIQSGVSYGLFGQTDFDGNKDHCLRINHAYGPQMYNDNSWVPDGRKQAFC